METKKEPTTWFLWRKLEDNYNKLYTIHLEAQLFSYVLLSIFCLTDLSKYPICEFIGKVLFVVSFLIILSPLNKTFYKVAKFTNGIFESALEILSLGAVIVQGILPAAIEKRNFFFTVLLIWIVFYFLMRAYRTYQLLGLYRLIAFSLAGIGLLELFTGHDEIVYQVVSVVGLALSVPAIDETLNEHLLRDL